MTTTEPAVRDLTLTEAQTWVTAVRATVEDARKLIVAGVLGRAWIPLGYQSWDEMVGAEFDGAVIRLPREERRELVGSLRDAGLSTRAIGTALGVSQPTVVSDIKSDQNLSPDINPVPVRTQGVDGRSYPTSRPAPLPEPPLLLDVEPDGDVVEPEREPYRPPPPRPAPVARPTPPRPAPAPAPPPAPVTIGLPTHDGRLVAYPEPKGRATFNQSSGAGISWAEWSWNPVTGCLHGCDYCYAREIATSLRFASSFPAGFTPLFHHERLDAPANTTIPVAYQDDDHQPCGDGSCKICAYRRVFVCSMADLYGRWVPEAWIAEVHASMLRSPEWEYLTLTKFPARYVGLPMPPRAWVGTSVDEQKRVRIAEDAFRQIDGVAVKWLSLEPLREPLEFTDLSVFDWVVIGAQTETRQPSGTVPAIAPPFEWVARIVAQAREAGCRVHMKPNLFRNPGMTPIDEYPDGGR